jgi:hypothetical protein
MPRKKKIILASHAERIGGKTPDKPRDLEKPNVSI